jgi:hypothetical protein
MPTNNFPNIGYITYGRDWNYFQKFTVTSTTFGGGSVDGYQPDGIITFSTQHVIFTVEGTANQVVEVSFNGTTVHCVLNAGDSAYKTIAMPTRRVSKFWLRASGGSPVVSVQAWGLP